MSTRSRLLTRLNSWLATLDARLVRHSHWTELEQAAETSRRLDQQLQTILDRLGVGHTDPSGPAHASGLLPADANTELRGDHPRLKELRRRYRAKMPAALAPSLWQPEYVRQEIDFRFFRGDGAYLWQRRDTNFPIHYVLTELYLEASGHKTLLTRAGEDGLFGAWTVPGRAGRRLSRDQLDSVSEIGFLEKTLGLSQRSSVRVLDIGAGYGRLAHRLAELLPNLDAVWCVDAVAESTFLAEYYLRFRGVRDRARVVPLYELDRTLAGQRVDLAVNIHSFSECPLAAVTWWLARLRELRVKYLLVVPNAGDHQGQSLLTREADNTALDFAPAIHEVGYRLVVQAPKYDEPAVQQYGVSPTYYHLFELTG